MGERTFPQRIKTILCNIYNGQHDHSEIADLVKISRIIVTSYLSYHRKNTNYLCIKNGLSLADLAYDCIGEVFEKTNKGEYKNLNSFFNSLNNTVFNSSPTEIYLAYKSLLLRIFEAQESRLFSLFDPNGFKISRNIKENIKTLDFFLFEKKNNELLLKAVPLAEVNSLPYLNIDDITTDFLSLAKNNKTTKQLLFTLHQIIGSQKIYRKEILLNDTVELFKRFYGISDKLNIEADYDFENIVNYKSDDPEINEICLKVMGRIKEKILINYYAKGKVTKEQANALYEAINDLIYDWKLSGNCTESYYEYFKSHLDINKNEYQIHIKDKFEYLIKEVKKEFTLLVYPKS